ncbi:uncharacterized protein [Cardiocondyla obscurior]|uniref:uncharacterized protein n=1 Tax=Cardiocondyla obscurior TaxID=286306 RepID=UPI00396569B0
MADFDEASERTRLQAMTVEQLKKEAKKNELIVTGNKEAIVDKIVAYQANREAGEGPSGIDHSEDDEEAAAGSTKSAPAGRTTRRIPAPDPFSLFLERMQRQNQQLLDQFRQMMQQAAPVAAQGADAAEEPLISPVPAENVSEVNHSLTGDAFTPVNLVRVIAQQIPQFGGSEDENVRSWVERVDQIAEIHRVTPGAILLAASSQFTKEAKIWYDFQMGPVLRSWLALKEALVRVFENKIPFTQQMLKIEARRWLYSKETFQVYAINKLSLIRRLNLPVCDTINLLVASIGKASLRATASTIRAETVEKFLEEMRKITAAASEYPKRYSNTNSRSFHSKELSARSSNGRTERAKSDGRADKQQSPVQGNQLRCFHCKAPGHRRTDCPSLQRNEGVRELKRPASVAAVEDISPASEEEEKPVVAAIDSNNLNLNTTACPVKTIKIKGRNDDLFALIDTGSPVSFIKNKAWEKRLTVVEKSMVDRRFFAIDDSVIKPCGKVQTEISFEQWPEKSFKVSLFVLECKKMRCDVVIGRDFLDKHGITATYKPKTWDSEGETLLWPRFDVCEVGSVVETYLEECRTDFGPEVSEKLKELIIKINEANIPEIKDDYNVRINLKDSSVYAYSPRKFAHIRIEIRKIIDDLLARDIIQVSNSPYCARIVPVQKRNGTTRLYVDLKPLNNRVAKQKFPFPLVEDCLSTLGNKSVFTVLDMKDGFHQIRVHPSDTKFLSFATPDGQYEYKRLPFGFSESPAEF